MKNFVKLSLKLKIVILLLTQNGYKINHFSESLLLNNEKQILKNDLYEHILIPSNLNDLTSQLNKCEIVIIMDFNYFKTKYKTDKEHIQTLFKIPILINSDYEFILPDTNGCKTTIFKDKEIISYSGILSRLRPANVHRPPHIPEINYFVHLF